MLLGSRCFEISYKDNRSVIQKQYSLAMFHKFNEKELLNPCSTRFVYSFIVLSNLSNDTIEGGLRRMVVSEQ